MSDNDSIYVKVRLGESSVKSSMKNTNFLLLRKVADLIGSEDFQPVIADLKVFSKAINDAKQDPSKKADLEALIQFVGESTSSAKYGKSDPALWYKVANMVTTLAMIDLPNNQGISHPEEKQDLIAFLLSASKKPITH